MEKACVQPVLRYSDRPGQKLAFWAPIRPIVLLVLLIWEVVEFRGGSEKVKTKPEVWMSSLTGTLGSNRLRGQAW